MGKWLTRLPSAPSHGEVSIYVVALRQLRPTDVLRSSWLMKASLVAHTDLKSLGQEIEFVERQQAKICWVPEIEMTNLGIAWC